jgi:hypothetical protein
MEVTNNAFDSNVPGQIEENHKIKACRPRWIN